MDIQKYREKYDTKMHGFLFGVVCTIVLNPLIALYYMYSNKTAMTSVLEFYQVFFSKQAGMYAIVFYGVLFSAVGCVLFYQLRFDKAMKGNLLLTISLLIITVLLKFL